MKLSTPMKILAFCISSFQKSWYFAFCISWGTKHSLSKRKTSPFFHFWCSWDSYISGLELFWDNLCSCVLPKYSAECSGPPQKVASTLLTTFTKSMR
jgi:hypothetical protein